LAIAFLKNLCRVNEIITVKKSQKILSTPVNKSFGTEGEFERFIVEKKIF
jgi:hypothetical protein